MVCVFVADGLSPSFSSCPSNILVYADRGETSATVDWTPPIASDNADDLPVVKSITGLDPPARLDQGKHYVVYSATDNANNREICQFEITVKG